MAKAVRTGRRLDRLPLVDEETGDLTVVLETPKASRNKYKYDPERDVTARQRRRVTLHQVADFTKIPVRTLEIIEQDDFGRLPGGIITRGYLRSFAAAVGQNPE